MRRSLSRIFITCIGLAVGLGVGLGVVLICPDAAHAQVSTVDLNGGLTEEPAQPTQPAATGGQQAPVVIPVPVNGQADGSLLGEGEGAAAAAEDLGNYHTDDIDGIQSLFGQRSGGAAGFTQVPTHHVVRKGDTLWDLCWFYFNNPWEWPKIWSYNPSITNPHWIYPGDLVRLYPKGLEPAKQLSDPSLDPEEPPDNSVQATPGRRYGVRLRQLAFVDRESLDFKGAIVGAVEEKLLLSTGDSIYVTFEGDPPKIGKRYAVYAELQKVKGVAGKDNKAKKKPGALGSYVRILGELRIESVKKGKRARATIVDSVDVIERGALVGPLQTTYRTVEPQRNEVDLQGAIVALISTDQLIGQGQIIFIDVGEDTGLKVGNRMFVVRRGDAYEEIMGPNSNVGQDDRRFPARAIGEILIVQTGKRVSVAMVTLALQEFGVGDLVLMRKAR